MADVLPDDSLDRLFRTARTAYHYQDRPVDEAILRAIWDLMIWGPTSVNQEPARIIWCTSTEAKDTLADCASGSNGKKIRAAPVSVIIGMDLAFYEQLPRLFPHTDARAWFVGNEALIRESAFRNSTLQGAYFIMAVRALGLACGPMSGFDAAKVDAAFFAGTSTTVNFISTLGYYSEEGVHDRLPRMAFEDATSFR